MATLGSLAKALLAPAPLGLPLPDFAFTATPPEGWEAAETGDPRQAFFRLERGEVRAEMNLCYIPDLRVYRVGDMDLVMRIPPPGEVPLDARLHFLVDATGRVTMNEKGAQTPLRPLDAHRDAAGSYGFWEDGARLHLSAIIGSNGRTGATSRQLFCNVTASQFTPGRMARWLWADAPLPDKRCILAELSAPLGDGAATRRQLEQSWETWRGWCAPRFARFCAGQDGG